MSSSTLSLGPRKSTSARTLGKLATPEAVQRLITASEVKRGLFQKSTTSFRVAAVNALAEARTTDAMVALRALEQDKDSDVRAAVMLALGRIARQKVADETVST